MQGEAEYQPLLGPGRRLADDRQGGDVDRCLRDTFTFFGRNVPFIVVGVAFLLFVSFSIVFVPQSVPVGFYGVRQNGLTGYVDLSKVWTPGLYFLPVRQTFILFPSTLITLEFSDRGYVALEPDLGFIEPDGPAISGRTGRDYGDPDSGGQPVVIALSFQVRIPRENIPLVYNAFSTGYRERYALLARNVVLNGVTHYTSAEFWENRQKISDDLRETLNETLAPQGAIVPGMQLLRVDFADKYEDLITATQIQSQKKITNEYQMAVTQLLKELDVRSAKVNAETVAIRANADARAASNINSAMAQGFTIEQNAKATAFQSVKSALKLTNDEMLQYVKVNAMRRRGAKGKTTLGLSYSEFAP